MKTFPQVSDTTAAYLAGLFDGEGSLSIFKYNCRGFLVWRITGTICSSAENGFLQQVYTACGEPGSIRRAQDADRHVRPKTAWAMGGEPLKWFLATIYPHVQLKSQHVGIGLDFIDLLQAQRARSARLSPRDHATRKLYQLALEAAHLESGSHRISRWAAPGSRARRKAQQVAIERTQVWNWQLKTELERVATREYWRRNSIPFPFFEAAA